MRIPFFAVHGTVGAGNSYPTDVVRLKKSLTKTGHGGSPSQPSPQFQSSTSRALQNFQSDWNLKPDAVVASGGPSEQTMDIALESLAWFKST